MQNLYDVLMFGCGGFFVRFTYCIQLELKDTYVRSNFNYEFILIKKKKNYGTQNRYYFLFNDFGGK